MLQRDIPPRMTNKMNISALLHKSFLSELILFILFQYKIKKIAIFSKYCYEVILYIYISQQSSFT